MMDIEILDEQFDLYPQKAIFWRTQHTLLLSDLHLGKINHFRKAGIPVPANTLRADPSFFAIPWAEPRADANR